MDAARRELREETGLENAARWHEHPFTTTYATSTDRDAGATLDDLSEAVATLEEIERIARRVLGGTHPTTNGIEAALRDARAALRAREAA